LQVSRRLVTAGIAFATLPIGLHSSPSEAKARDPLVSASGGGPVPNDLLRQTFHLARGRKSLVVPYGDSNESKAIRSATPMLKHFGARNIQVLSLNASKAARQLDEADLVWFGGGLQTRHMQRLSTVPGLINNLRQAHRAGTAMMGGSAGAAVMSKLMISGGSGGTAHTRSGLGFLHNIVIDQHVIARQREWRLRQVIARNRSYIGVGIDEATGVTIQNGKLRVYGKSRVILTRWKSGSISETHLRNGKSVLL